MKRYLLALIVSVAAAPLLAQVTLPRLIRDSMVLQRDQKVNLWGWASANEKIAVQFNGKKYRLQADKNGNWKMQIPATRAGGPYTITILASNKIVIRDILFGDVWFCSGQSNMVHQTELHKYRYAKEIAEASYPDIRQFWIPTLTNLQNPEKNIPTVYWKSANPKDILQFSAVAYFFAKKIHDQYHIPIGIINASVGGTPIEAWMSEEGLKEVSAIENIIEKNKDSAYVNETNRQAFAFHNAMKQKTEADKGLTGDKKWHEPSYIPKEWRRINIPGYWEDQGIKGLNGVVWYRREIDVPASITNVPATLFMGRIVDADFVYINGVLAGNTTYMYPQRRYLLPAGLLKAGKNLIVMRVINNNGKGGFVPDKPYCLFAAMIPSI